MNEELLRKQIASSILPSGLMAYLLFELEKMTDEQKQKLLELIKNQSEKDENS